MMLANTDVSTVANRSHILGVKNFGSMYIREDERQDIWWTSWQVHQFGISRLIHSRVDGIFSEKGWML